MDQTKFRNQRFNDLKEFLRKARDIEEITRRDEISLNCLLEIADQLQTFNTQISLLTDRMGIIDLNLDDDDEEEGDQPIMVERN